MKGNGHDWQASELLSRVAPAWSGAARSWIVDTLGRVRDIPTPQMILNRQGRNRWVLLIGRYAVKFPSPRSSQDFLFGLLNNMKEARDGHLPGRCPVLLTLPLGFAIVMRRAMPLTASDFATFDHGAFCQAHGVRVEKKPDSFGLLNGQIVALDYGW